MTTITPDQIAQPTHRSLRPALGGFVAGAVLAAGAFFGISALTDSGSATPAPAQATHVTTPAPAPVAGPAAQCPVVHGNC